VPDILRSAERFESSNELVRLQLVQGAKLRTIGIRDAISIVKKGKYG